MWPIYFNPAVTRTALKGVVNHSHFNEPIERRAERLSGHSREWGDASNLIKLSVVKEIIKASGHLSKEDQAILIAIANHESGFNPDAASTLSSASGVFQIIDDTARGLGLADHKRFDTKENIIAGVKLYEENLKYLNRRTGTEKAAYMYKLHHDGPVHDYGGLTIGYKHVVPVYIEVLRKIK